MHADQTHTANTHGKHDSAGILGPLGSRGRVGVQIAAAVLVLGGLVMLLLAGQVASSASAAASSAQAPLTSSQVVAAFQHAGLSVEHLRQQPIDGSISPSGPPATEREAWAFEIAGLAPRGGRILVFADDAHLQQKAAWFQRVGAAVTISRNVILWLDPALQPSDATRYRAALQELG